MQSFLRPKWKSILSVLAVIFTFNALFAQHSISSLPNPKTSDKNAFVSNPDSILSSSTVQEINNIARAVEKRSGTEYTVVVVNDFEGHDAFEFALEVFNTWGVGKKKTNNGLLLFIAKERRDFRFVSGYGLEGIFPDLYVRRLGDKYLVPNFRAEDYDAGVLEVSKAIEAALLADDVQGELERMSESRLAEERAESERRTAKVKPFVSVHNENFLFALFVILIYTGLYFWLERTGDKWKRERHKKRKQGCIGGFIYIILSIPVAGITLLFLMLFFAFFSINEDKIFQESGIPYLLALCGSYVLLFKIFEIREYIKEFFLDEENEQKALHKFQRTAIIPYIFSPLMLFSFLFLLLRIKSTRVRFVPPDDSGNWERQNKDFVALKIFERYLSAGQLKEESLGTKFYEVWINKLTKEWRVFSWNGKNSHTYCPSCGFKTYKLRTSIIAREATYTMTGLLEFCNQCAFCQHTEKFGGKIIPKKKIFISSNDDSPISRGWSADDSSERRRKSASTDSSTSRSSSAGNSSNSQGKASNGGSSSGGSSSNGGGSFGGNSGSSTGGSSSAGNSSKGQSKSSNGGNSSGGSSGNGGGSSGGGGAGGKW